MENIFNWKRQVFVTAVLLVALCTCAVSVHVTDAEIVLCPRGFTEIFTQPLDTLQARSLMDCAAQCFQRGDCGSFNYCPEEEGGEEEVTCQILTNQWIPSCQDLYPAQSSSCQHGFDTTVCQNGGTFDGLDCQCPPQYAGITCQRYIRDCTEMYMNGYTTSIYNGVYLIQPTGSPEPFLVFCTLSSGYGITHAFQRHHLDLKLTWQDAKRGYPGALVTCDCQGHNFFIGLDNLHYLTSQDNYQAHMRFVDLNSQAHVDTYERFTVGPESQSYHVTYSKFEGSSSSSLPPAWPIFFSTQDNDTSGCFNSTRGTGWYGVDCNTFGLFGDHGILLMINGSLKQFQTAKLYFIIKP